MLAPPVLKEPAEAQLPSGNDLAQRFLNGWEAGMTSHSELPYTSQKQSWREWAPEAATT